ncbi:hypothetical protein [Paenibacillus elgii]|uniref:hypothetical protein n=1 Tax=Paenibacillus elgii TaxID=189691 RepID=UPI000FDB8537|nr:hypothetical protein [Paenibacillus elgii]
MNISGLIRGLTGDAQAAEPKALELKVGQVVKGMVLQVGPEQEALVNIGGVQVRAQLEAPLKPGEVTMLQVQPESSGGQVVLKPLQSNVQISDGSLADIVKTMGLSDSPANRQLVQLLNQAGVALTKENVQAFAKLQAQMPPNMPQEAWLSSAVIAFQKGLPLTPETVASVRQAVQGPPFHEVLDQLGQLAGRELEGNGSLSPQSRELLQNVRQLVQQLRDTASLLIGAKPDGGEGTPVGAQPGAGASAGAQAAAQPGAGAGAGAQAAAQPMQAPQEGGNLIGRLMKTLGIEHEHQAMKLLERTMPDAPQPGLAHASAGAQADFAKSADTLKSLLMQLSQASDAPQGLKDAAQQAVQQITGQQLMLSADRNAMLSHLTLFVPIMHAGGEQTAAVHIQSRKGKNGSLDASNCRLVFDLRMKMLGDTMVDVQVVNNIVSLHVHNDSPFTQELLEAHKEEISAGLASIGYQFISMKYSPYPTKAVQEGNEAISAFAETINHPGAGRLPNTYSQKPYKGMDIRI